MKTYLQLVNSVLRRLREDEVSSLYENRLSSLIAEFVNDAKNQVENAHDWSDLREDILVGTSDGVDTYAITGSGNRATVMDVRNMTTGTWMRQKTAQYMRRQEMLNPISAAPPIYYALQGTDASGDTQMKVWPTPDKLYQLKAHVIQRTDDLEAEGDTVSVPHKPITLLAYAMSAQDRGDVSAADLQSLYSNAKRSLGEHVMLDVAHNPEEMIWGPE